MSPSGVLVGSVLGANGRSAHITTVALARIVLRACSGPAQPPLQRCFGHPNLGSDSVVPGAVRRQGYGVEDRLDIVGTPRNAIVGSTTRVRRQDRHRALSGCRSRCRHRTGAPGVRAEPQGPNEPEQPLHGQPKWWPSASCLAATAGSRTAITVRHSGSVCRPPRGRQGELVLQSPTARIAIDQTASAASSLAGAVCTSGSLGCPPSMSPGPTRTCSSKVAPNISIRWKVGHMTGTGTAPTRLNIDPPGTTSRNHYMSNDEPQDIHEIPSSTPDFKTELAAQLAELMPEAIADGKSTSRSSRTPRRRRWRRA